MGSLTAQILVGDAHPYHGGINPTYYLFLSENSRAAWILVNQNISDGQFLYLQSRGRVKKKKIVWIPTVENMLEDALLMIAIHVIEDPQIIDFAKKIYANIDEKRLEMYDHLSYTQRDQLYQKCRHIENWPKIVVTVTRGSTIRDQLPVLKNYSIESELCVSNG